jgi:hypothetical protein
MASPFAKFRKNQKLMMVALTALAMIAFVILPNFIDNGPSDRISNAEVVSTKYGVLTETDLQSMYKRRVLANQFINNALMRANLGQAPNIFGRPTEGDLVETMLRYRKAEELGLYVPDNRVVAMLDTLTDKKVDGDGFAQIAQQLGVQQTQIMDALRYELMADQYEQLHFPATQIQTPVSRWEIYQSLNREVSAEVIPLEVDKFSDRTPKPDDATLRAFFEQHRLEEATYYGIEPGFKQPHRVAFQYFKIKLDDFTSQVQVSEDEIVAAYERDKDTLYRYRPDSSLINNPFAVPGAAIDSGIPTDDEVPAPVEPVTESEAPAAADTPANETPAAEAPAEGAAPSEPAPAVESPPATEGAPETEKPADAPQSSVRRSPFRLASYRLQDETPAAPESPGTDPAAQAAPAADETPAPVATDAEQTATAPPVDAPPLEDEEPLANDQWLPPGELQDGPDPEFQPLWKVREQVRQSVAREKAQPLMDKVIGDLTREMRRYESQWRGWNGQKAQKPDLPMPTPLNFSDLASKNGVEAKQTSLLARDTLLFSTEHTLGNSYVGETPREEAAVVNAAYSGIGLYQPQNSQDVQGNRYLFWKTEEKEPFIPTFEEVKGDVEAAWRKQEARKLAIAEANKLAEEAKKSDKSLTEVFADRKDLVVTTTRPFTWKFGGFMFGQQEIPIRTSQVEGVDDAGDEFMRTVYGLNVGEIGVAMNETKKAAYLIRLVNTTPDLNALHSMFLSTPYQAYGRAGENDALLRQANWRRELNVQANVQWLRAPQEMQ